MRKLYRSAFEIFTSFSKKSRISILSHSQRIAFENLTDTFRENEIIPQRFESWSLSLIKSPYRSTPDKVETKDEKPARRQEKNEDRGSGDDNDSDDDRRLVITIRVRAR